MAHLNLTLSLLLAVVGAGFAGLDAPALAGDVRSAALVPDQDAAQDESDTLVERVRARLHEERHKLSTGTLASVHVEAKGSLVLLLGSVPTQLDKLLIDVLARSVEGVRAVSNALIVPGEEPPHGLLARS